MSKPQLIHTLLRVTATLVLVYGAFVLLVFFNQRRLLYVPARAPMDSLLIEARQQGLEPWRNATGDLIGWRCRIAAKGPRTLILHGNGGCAVDRSVYIKGLTSAGFSELFILEYPGYGARPGSPSQASLFSAATEALKILTQDGPVYLVGESLGTGVAAYLAGQNPKTVEGLLMITPYHNMTDVAQSAFPILPVKLMLLDRFPSAQFLQNYHGPMAVLLAGNDTVIPNQFGRKLYDTYTGPKKLWLIPETGHNNVSIRPAGWWQEVGAFLRKKD